MARFVLVHGAFGGGYLWGPLVEQLEQAGHTAKAPDLPGGGDDQTPVEEITLEACAERICEVLCGGDEPAILVGSSMGGVVATQAAARCPDQVAHLVYVAAFLPEDGQSLLDLTELPEGEGDMVQANITIEGDPPVAVMPREASITAFHGSCDEELASWAVDRLRPQAVAVFTDPVSIDEGALNGIPISYVFCTRDLSIPPALQRRMAKAADCSRVYQLDTDHVPQLSVPGQLAEILDGIAAERGE